MSWARTSCPIGLETEPQYKQFGFGLCYLQRTAHSLGSLLLVAPGEVAAAPALSMRVTSRASLFAERRGALLRSSTDHEELLKRLFSGSGALSEPDRSDLAKLLASTSSAQYIGESGAAAALPLAIRRIGARPDTVAERKGDSDGEDAAEDKDESAGAAVAGHSCPRTIYHFVPSHPVLGPFHLRC